MPSDDEPFARPTATKPLLVGVLPHTFCNPKVQGCGFCTFPHERFQRPLADEATRSVAREVEQIVTAHPSLSEQPVCGVYFGGGTANLAPVPAFRALCESVAQRFATTQAEVTLEGVPKYFSLRDFAIIHTMRDTLPARHYRVSMGVQTFDRAQLEAMGRDAFGDADDVAKVVQQCHTLGMTASGDFLVNLPGQRPGQMLADVARAVQIGFDQICLYHLVLTDRMAVPWARDPALVQALPNNPRAAANWNRAREALLASGYVQTTLTNFEAAPVARSSRRFRYEAASFTPDQHDAIGFGPGAISTVSNDKFSVATKWMNTPTSARYTECIRAGRSAVDRVFEYERRDMQLLFVVRSLARMWICNATYRHRFGVDFRDDFGSETVALEKAGLVTCSAAGLALTPKGMFYADSVAGLLAWRRTTSLRLRARDHDGPVSHMG
ncbi:MAG: Fe-S oxidoreductase [Myxococcota bacterium]